MSRRLRRTHSSAFKAKVALAAVRGEKTLAELARQHDVHANQITASKNRSLTKAADEFGGEPSPDEPTVDLKVPHATIGPPWRWRMIFQKERSSSAGLLSANR